MQKLKISVIVSILTSCRILATTVKFSLLKGISNLKGTNCREKSYLTI